MSLRLPHQARREVDAQQKCRANSDYPGRCVVSVWVRNGCAATAVKVNADGFVTRYASGFARSKASGQGAAP